ncbi:caspase family protein [Streptomyces sp. NPDC086787]|uniref:caspase family protein n=1 Tax=Streptomyces sp. NPDC086787 TaxID=3365759 RepID=UPI0037F78FCD
MRETEPRGPRRFLIAGAVAHYPKAPPELEWDRPGLVEARRRMVDLFTRELCYDHVSELGLNPNQDQLLKELRDFCRAPDRRPDDIVAVYLAAHGEILDNGDFVLLTSDTDPDDLYDALRPSTLAHKILAGTKVRRLLLMLDTCFSGQGANELLPVMARLKNDWQEEDAGLAVITSAQPRELARTGAFPELFAEAVTSLATAGYAPGALALDAVVSSTRTNPKRPDHQHIGLEIIGLTGEIPPFLPNAKHSPRLSHTDLALQQAAEWRRQDSRRDEEFRTRLLRRAMGHRDEDQVGWWFSGRHRALEDITAWLGELPDQRPVSVVTGDPGSGKTAVLGLLAAVSDPEYRRTVPLASLGLTSGQLPRERAIRTPVYAQNLTDQQVVRAVAAALRLPPAQAVADLLNHLGSAPDPARPQVILIDGLDEAVTPETLCGQVLRPLMELAGRHVRLLLGTRPHLFPALGLRREDHIDLDAPMYADPYAVLAYTVRNLMDAHPDSPYTECDNDLLRAVAQAVARAAGHSFLVARITAGTLAASPVLPDPWDTAWRTSLPSAAADAMHRDLHQRFGPEHAARILDLLRPLAYAEGQGLPWEDLWARIASRLSGGRYTNDDLHRLRRDAGAYVVEAVEDGRSVYRLYHEAMAEYLRQGQDAKAAHRALATALREAVPYRVDGTRDWARAHPYAQRHLATHAALGDRLDSLLTDPDYLAHADCDRLAPHLLTAGSETARLYAAIYLASLGVHRRLPVPGRRQILAVDAARFNDPAALRAFSAGLGERDWRPMAATGSQVSGKTRHVLAGHTGAVNAVACAAPNGRPVAVTGSEDATVRLWDLATGQQVGEPLTGHTGPVRTAACTELDGRPITVTGSDDMTLRIWDLTTGHSVREPLTGHQGPVNRVVCAELHGRAVAVSGSDDGTIRIWDLAKGWQVGAPMETGFPVYDLASGVLDGRPVVVASTGWGRAHMWDLPSQKELGPMEPGETAAQIALSCANLNGRPVVVGYSQAGWLQIWSMKSRRIAALWQCVPLAWTPTVGCAELGGRPTAIAASDDGAVRIWDLATHHQLGTPLSGHASGVTSLAHTVLSGQHVAVSGSSDGTARVWDLSRTRDVGRPLNGHTAAVRTMNVAVVNRRPVLLTGSLDGTVRAWDPATCLPVGEHLRDQQAHCVTDEGRRTVTAGARRPTVRMWDSATADEVGSPVQLPQGPVLRLACAHLEGHPVAAALTAFDVWRCDLTTGGVAVRLHSFDIEFDNEFPPFDCAVVGGRQVAVHGTRTTVQIVDLASGGVTDHRVHGYRRGALACTVLAGTPVAVIACDDGAVRVLDLRTGLVVGLAMTGHPHHVSTLACAELDGRPVVLAGFPDGTVNIWDLRTRTITQVLHVPGPCNALALHDSAFLACGSGNDIVVFTRR